MKTFHDYESLGWATSPERQDAPALCEGYNGTQIVEWYGNIERQLQDLINQSEGARNWPYVDKLRQFLSTWRDNRLDGSINLEIIRPLETAAGGLSVDTWKLQNYFSNLRDQLRKLIASEEELPRNPEPLKKSPRPRGGSAPKAPPSDFGAEKTPGAPAPDTEAAAAAKPPGGVAPVPGA